MSASGKGGNNRKHRNRFNRREEAQRQDRKKHSENILSDSKFEVNRKGAHDRPRWTAPVMPANPITTPDCPWCGKQIKDITVAISDRNTGLPIHFDCVLDRIVETAYLETNDTVCYIGGGRFGVVHYNNPPDTRDFSIKKIIEWELKDREYDWRKSICEYFSVT